jgi:hypothetical protein
LDQLFPQSTDIAMRRFVDVNVVRLIEAEQRRLGVAADLLKGLVDCPEAIA